MKHLFRLRMTLFVGLSLVLSACATAIEVPSVVAEPVQVAVLDHGRHASLAIEQADRSMVRYSYGEWDWYALGATGPVRALAALFWPTTATLGRRVLPGPLSRDTIAARLREGVEAVFIIEVEAAKARGLVERLDRLFVAGESERVYNPDFDLEFVPLANSYWLGRNSNQVTTEWLEEMGCRTDGPAILSVWTVRPR